MSDISIEVLSRAIPDKYRKNLNDELLNNINTTLTDTNLQAELRDNFISYMSVLNDGRYKITDYLSAVKYVTHKLSGSSNIDAYSKTFPDRYKDMHVRGLSNKDMSSIITVYNKTKLVNAIMEQSLIPVWIINQDLRQKAINKLADLMMNANSEKVQSDSAGKLVDALKPPEVTKVELDIGANESDEIKQLKELTLEMAAQQKRLIESGVMTAKAAAEQKVVKGKTYDMD